MAEPARRPSRTAPPPLYARVERRLHELTRQIVEALVATVPIYGQLPPEQLQGEVAAIVTENLRIFFRTLREGRDVEPEELAGARQSAARRAEERVPLGALLSAYHLGASMAWDAMHEHAGPADTEALLAAAGRVLRYLTAVTDAVASAYLEEQQAIHSEEREARRQLVRLLVAGEPTEAAAARVGVPVASAYVVVALRFGDHPDELGAGVMRNVAGRRKVRRAQAALDAWAGESVLALLDPSGGIVLLRVDDGDEELLGEVPDIVRSCALAAGAPVWAGFALAARPGDLPQCAEQTREVLAVVTRTGRPPGAYSLQDVLLEYQLSRPSDALPILSRLVEPLEENPDLLRTLETYLANDLDRRRTAAELHVHPNTLDYRLRRVVESTGLNPSTATGLQLLGAALAARRLSAEGQP